MPKSVAHVRSLYAWCRPIKAAHLSAALAMVCNGLHRVATRGICRPRTPSCPGARSPPDRAVGGRG
eukprot:15456365-Alexandrium_andersonii.AAC.1